MKLTDGERTRALHTIQRLRATIDSIEMALKDVDDAPPEPGDVQAVMNAAFHLSMTLSRLWAYWRVGWAKESTT